MNTNKPKSWRLCLPCGEKMFKKTVDPMGLTVTHGECPECGEKETLIPVRDFTSLINVCSAGKN